MLNPTTGSGRLVLSQKEIDAFQPSGSLVVDDRRRRPLYFDGRFLAARDLVREQAYFLARQGDIARSAGFGAVQGLMVRLGPAADTVTISAGQGVTPSGELVIIPTDHTISLANVPEEQKLNTNFGLMPIPRDPSRNRSGLYVIGLRAVEFSANPIASYPTTISGPRSVHDGDIVEATAITLVHYPDPSTTSELAARRSVVAREIFFSGTVRGVPSAILPLAMVALNFGNVVWVDTYMVRRELGAEYGDLLRFGPASRATQQAFLLQYDAHLNDVLHERQLAGQTLNFAATQYFSAVPPCGRLPMACINTDDFTQSFFPQETDVSLSIAPADELPSLIEQAVALPPIDLIQSAQVFHNISVLVLAPVARQQFAELKAKLETIPQQLSAPVAVAARMPLDLLRLRRGATPLVPVAPPPPPTSNAMWKDIVAAPFAYYIRLRSAPESVEISTTEPEPEETQTAQETATTPTGPPKTETAPQPEPPKPPEPPPATPEPPKQPTPEPPKPPAPEPPKPPLPEPPKPPTPEPSKPPLPQPPKPPQPKPPAPKPPAPKPPAPKPPAPKPPVPKPPAPKPPVPKPPAPKPPAPKPPTPKPPMPKPPAPKPPAPKPPTPKPPPKVPAPPRPAVPKPAVPKPAVPRPAVPKPAPPKAPIKRTKIGG